MMNIEIRKVDKFADVKIEVDGLVYYVGMLNQKERIELINELSDAIKRLSSFGALNE